jgi:hypothetical protein
MDSRKALFIVAIIIGAFFLYRLATRPKGYDTTEGVVATEEPLQTDLVEGDEKPFPEEASGYKWTITPKAEYRIAARVLSTERYRTEWQSTLSPVDLALGWGALSSKDADRWIDWSQSGRWYFYQWSGDSPYKANFIQDHSANVHIIPSTGNLRSAVLGLHSNEMVLLEGLLVNVDGIHGEDSYWWHTSLSRKDTGDGSCELLYLKRLVVDGKEYR